MSNIITTKHGNGIPEGKLKHYEFGYSDDKKNLYLNTPTALIALNLGKFDVDDCEEIIAGKDLNSYIDVGTYICKDIGSLINKPNTIATEGKLFVIKITNNEEIFQILIDNNNSLWVRIYIEEWGEWERIFTNKGGEIEGAITSSLVSEDILSAGKGKVLINSSSNPGDFVMLDKLNSLHGYFVDGVQDKERVFYYILKSNIDAGLPEIMQTLILLDENGKSSFPGGVTINDYLYIPKTTDAKVESYTYPPITIGPPSGTHLEIDNNKILAKTNEGTGGELGLNMGSGLVRISGKGLLFPVNTPIFGYSSTLGENIEAFRALNENNNILIGYGNYKNDSGNVHIYCSDLQIYSKKAAESGGFRPYYRKGDTISIDIDTSGYITSSGTIVFFNVPIDRPILGNPTITASTISGFKIRQNSKYLYGSSGNVYAKPSSYTVSYNSGPYITIYATFSNTTNVENNSATGVSWRGRITLT